MPSNVVRYMLAINVRKASSSRASMKVKGSVALPVVLRAKIERQIFELTRTKSAAHTCVNHTCRYILYIRLPYLGLHAPRCISPEPCFQ